MQKGVTIIVVLALAAAAGYFIYISKRKGNANKFKAGTAASPTAIVPSFDAVNIMKRVKNFEITLKNYAIKNKCNTQYGFLIDMRIPSYRKRFFVYNLKNDSVIDAGLVAHGTGTQPKSKTEDLYFSNTPDSKCTSLGKYKISNSYTGAYGFSYRLIGVDSTNNNALKRAIVLHGHNCVPDVEDTQYGWPICFSYGCPMVSPSFLKKLKGYISQQGKQPIVLWIFY